jgi:hypothetical protein
MTRRLLLLALARLAKAQPPSHRHVSGVYPHLAMFNSQGECGTGAVVPWAGRLWVLTYSPHMPGGSDDKLYEIDPRLNRNTRPESIGGTPANRMIHRESSQLFIGPYTIDANGAVRAIPYAKMFGRPTGNARHLTDPAGRIYLATMEEGFYEVDVKTLSVTQLYEDANAPYLRKDTKDLAGPLLPGYHGKGAYSGQGRLVYANNGEYGTGALPPGTPSGCLAEWDGKTWRVVRRNQFTEVTGPGGIHGNANPAKDPVWSVGWDHRSVILMLLDNGNWHTYRLPKATHTYDGAHGWNTEWPRIRDIGQPDLLMTMHGMFWRFPRAFSTANSAGLAPRSTYLRVIGDFTNWQNRIVFGCDDTAQNEFFNTRRAKGKIAPPGQAQSNLWFVDPSRLDRLGPAIGRGGVWVRDDIKRGEASEPFLFSGFDQRMLHLHHESAAPITFTLEVDPAGNGRWSKLQDVQVPARGYTPVYFPPRQRTAWVRLTPDQDCRQATAYFQYSALDQRSLQPAPLFAGLARGGPAPAAGGLLWARGEKRGTLLFATAGAVYELDAGLQLNRLNDPALHAWMQQKLAPPPSALEADAASIIYIDEQNKRWRLPRADAALTTLPAGLRVAREVSTERDLLNAGGLFYELPANNAAGIAAVRPIAAHNFSIRDFCSWRGLTVMSGVSPSAPAGEHIVRSGDGDAALWLGVSDDLWQAGKPRGSGGPWKDSPVLANVPSDPFLMTGFDQKTLTLSHDQSSALRVRVEVDITGTGLWVNYAELDVPAGQPLEHRFPPGFNAYWLRTVSPSDARATALLSYQ